MHRKLISNPLPFQQTVTPPTKRINTCQNTADQPTCSKTLDQSKYNGPHKQSPTQAHPSPPIRKNEDWIKKKDQARNNKGQFTSPNKIADKEADLNLSIISDEDDFYCYFRSDGKPIHTNIDDELQLIPKENNLTPEQGIYIEKPKTPESVRKSKRLPFAKQTEKLYNTEGQ